MNRLPSIESGSIDPALPGNGPIYYSDSRDNRSYIGYVGFQHNLLPNLNISAKAGVQYTENYNDPLSSPSVAPYAVMSVIYTYIPGSYAEIGLNQAAKRDGCGRT